MRMYLANKLVLTLPLAILAGSGVTAQTLDRSAAIVASTVPPNGDLNPYGVAMVPMTSGNLTQGHILVSNFNNSANLQGTGTTIVDIAPDGATGVFAQINASMLPGPCPGGIGLTTALAVLKPGWVVVGSLPTTDGTAATAQAGCLLVLNNMGKVVKTISGNSINGPWDMTALDLNGSANLFVTNVLYGTVAGNGQTVSGGTVVRINLTSLNTAMPAVQSVTAIGSGFPERTDPQALVIGPTGVALNPDGTLYVADTLNNRIASIANAVTRTTSAGTGVTVLTGSGLNQPLGLVNRGQIGDLLAANGGDGLLVEFTPSGRVIASKLVVAPPGTGALFGIAASMQGLYYVDDSMNTLNLLASGGSGSATPIQ